MPPKAKTKNYEGMYERARETATLWRVSRWVGRAKDIYAPVLVRARSEREAMRKVRGVVTGAKPVLSTRQWDELADGSQST